MDRAFDITMDGCLLRRRWPAKWSRAAVVIAMLLLLLPSLAFSGCIDTHFFKKTLWPEPPPEAPPVFLVLAQMSHNFTDTQPSHMKKTVRETFLLKERSEWIEVSITVTISQNIPDEVFSAEADTRSMEVRLEHLDTGTVHISKVYESSDTEVFDRIYLPRSGYWQMTITATGVGYTDPLGNIHQDSFSGLCTGMVIR